MNQVSAVIFESFLCTPFETKHLKILLIKLERRKIEHESFFLDAPNFLIQVSLGRDLKMKTIL